MRMLVANTTSTQRHTENLLDRAYARMKQMEEGRYESIKMVEDSLNERAQREIEQAQKRDKMQREDEMWQSARILFPTVVNKLTGKNLLPEARSPAEDIMIRLVGSFSTEQLMRINSVLNQSQQAGFHELLQMAVKKEEEAVEAHTKAKEAKVVGIGSKKELPSGGDGGKGGTSA